MAEWLGNLMSGWPAWAIGVIFITMFIAWIVWLYYAEIWPFKGDRVPFKGENHGKTIKK